jgi:hypothetical protein
MKINVNATERFEALRDSDHDDLVLAVALGCWAGERAWLEEAQEWQAGREARAEMMRTSAALRGIGW